MGIKPTGGPGRSHGPARPNIPSIRFTETARGRECRLTDPGCTSAAFKFHHINRTFGAKAGTKERTMIKVGGVIFFIHEVKLLPETVKAGSQPEY
ncbi:hypothetical protein ACFLZ2_02550, partial [Candidatus Margulisiibacteriota bacterium]